MGSLKASAPGLAKIKQARKAKGWSVDDLKWLEEASKILGVNWEETGYFAEGISEGTWKRFLAGKRPIKAEAFKAYSEMLGLNWQEIANRGSVQDWGEAPESSIFYGRTQELATLQQWILQDRCRLVTVLGMGGIGKTALAVKLVESIQDQFEYFIWRSLRYPQSIEAILVEFSQFLSPKQKPNISASIGTQLSEFIDCLRKHRCLLVLDNFEAILRDGESSGETVGYSPGNYQLGYEAYGELIKRVGESQHQSSLLLISREKSIEMASIPGHSLQVNGLLEADAREILRTKGLSGEDKWGTLINLYRGNPLALNIVSATIQELFNSDVAEFLKQNTLVITGITDILEQQFNRLSDLEINIVYWLAIHRQAVGLSQLQTDILSPVKKSELIEALQALSWRSLIEKCPESSEVLFTLSPVVMKYVTNQLVEQICEDLFAGTIEYLRIYTLVSSQEGNNQDIQFKPILPVVKDQLIATFRSEKRLLEHLKTILSKLQSQPALELGYAVDNILKLIAELESGC